MQEVKILTDSINPFNNRRFTTFQLKYPRIVHAEVLTHRVFSRNAGSSRAKPVSTILGSDVFISDFFGSNKPGMQPGEPIAEQVLAKKIWLDCHKQVLKYTKKLQDLNVHKQWANRMIEPFTYIDVVLSSTEWDNFFELRTDQSAQYEIRMLAEEMKRLLSESKPNKIRMDLHTPYVTEEEKSEIQDVYLFCLISAARCARVSYKPFDSETSDFNKDIELGKRLLESKHMSPFEHIGLPSSIDNFYYNIRGWKSFRYLLERTNYFEENRKNGLTST